MDPYSSPYIQSPIIVPKTHFPHSLLSTRESEEPICSPGDAEKPSEKLLGVQALGLLNRVLEGIIAGVLTGSIGIL